MRSKLVALSALFALAACPKNAPVESAASVAPAPAPAPATDAEAIFAGYAEWAGGCDSDVIPDVLTMNAELSIEQQGIRAQGSIAIVNGQAYRSSFEFPGLGAMVRGYNAGTAWATDAMTGPRILDGMEAAQAERAATTDAHCTLAAGMFDVQPPVAGERDGRQTWTLAGVDAHGQPQTHVFWADNAQLIETTQTVSTEMGDITTSMTIEDWLDHAGLKFPGRVVMKMGPTTLVTTHTNIVTNPDVAPEISMPDEIVALMPSDS